MLVIAVHRTTGAILNNIQNTPNGAYVPGSRARTAAKQLGGQPDDYLEYEVPPKFVSLFFSAKSFKWDKNNQRVLAVQYTPDESEAIALDEEREVVETRLIELQCHLDAADKLEIDADGEKSELDALKKKHKELKDKKKDKDNG